MIVDVEISIANDQGVPIQRFVKHFDGRYDSKDYSKINQISNDFQEFLAEYLSFNGRMLREQLNSDWEKNLSDKKMPSAKSEIVYFNEYKQDEIQYFISIDNQKISGKIPLKRIVDLKEQEENAVNKVQTYNAGNAISPGDIANNIQLGNSEQEEVKKRTLEEVNGIFIESIQSVLMQAIGKYEANFLHVEDLGGNTK